MTTTTYTPELARQTFAGSGPAPKLNFGGILKSERIKLTSLRSFRITLLLTVLAGLGMSLLSGFAFTSQFEFQQLSPADMPAEALQSYLLNVSTFSSAFLALIFGVLGVFAISSEYSSGMILSSLAAVPRRTPMYIAKAIVLGLISAVTALALMLAGLAIGVIFLPEAAAELTSSVVISGVLGATGYLLFIALLGFGISTVLRSTAGGIAVVVGITFVAPVVMQLLTLTSWEWVPVVSNYLPMTLGTLLGMGTVENEGMPSYWISLLAMLIWALVPMIAGHALLKSRDAK
ncbi:MAG: ABC transporter permease subunit [Leucobacter sp.]